jgi:hypothetical protein
VVSLAGEKLGREQQRPRVLWNDPCAQALEYGAEGFGAAVEEDLCGLLAGRNELLEQRPWPSSLNGTLPDAEQSITHTGARSTHRAGPAVVRPGTFSAGVP